MPKAWMILADHFNPFGPETEIGTWGGMDGVCCVRGGKTVGTTHKGETGLDGINKFQTVPIADMVKFRLKDDDGELCYSGVMTPELADSPDILIPLDDYATPMAGATTLEILKDGIWKQV
jgi:hypothetical protein